MEALNIRKRKKRKTRRCLDELRRKIHRPNDKCKISKNNLKEHRNGSCCLKTSSYITSNRLTLFPKAVRSDTVTRLHLANIDNKVHLQLKSHKENENSENDTNKKNIVETDLNKQNNVLDSTGESISIDVTELSKETPKSISLFSAENQNGHANINNILNNSLEISLLSSSSSSTSINSLEPKSCDIMDSIEHYIKKTYPQNSECDSIKKTRATLMTIFKEHCQNKDVSSNISIDNTLSENYLTDEVPNETLSTKEPSTVEVVIVQDPQHYIEYIWNQYNTPSNSEIVISSTDSSSSSDSIFIPNSSPLPSIVYDSPEYSYYPHRLN